MPLALTPKLKNYVVLASDMHKTTKERPVFIYQFLNGDQWDEVAEIHDKLAELDESSSGKDASTIVYNAASVGLVGWKNMIDPKTKKQIKFAPGGKSLKRVVGFLEAKELTERIMTQQRPKASDLKNLG